MAIAAQEQVSPDFPSTKRGSRQPGAAWSNSAQLWRSLPIVRLVAEIWTHPRVSKIEILTSGEGIQVHVVLSGDLREAAPTIFGAEREYLNATKLHPFDLHVTEQDKVPTHVLEGYALAGFETVLER
jgi:hypothetical protein